MIGLRMEIETWQAVGGAAGAFCASVFWFWSYLRKNQIKTDRAKVDIVLTEAIARGITNQAVNDIKQAIASHDEAQKVRLESATREIALEIKSASVDIRSSQK